MRKFVARLGAAGTVVILAGAVLLVRHERLLASPGEARNARARASALAGGVPAAGHADDATDIYAADRPGMLNPVVRNFPSRIYVPNSDSNTVDVIDPVTFKIIDHFPVGAQPQHVVPSYDLKTLWVLNDKGNSLTKIDPATGKKGETVPVDDPYNLYFTPDGSHAIVVAEALHRLDFRDAQTMKLNVSLHVPCAGVNHIDYAPDGSYFISSCEFDGHLLKIETATRKILGKLALDPKDMPQDVRISPDGKIFYVADMMANGVHIIDPDKFAKIGFLATGKGAHGLLISRDSKLMYVSNRGEGSISVVDLATRKIVDKWQFPDGGSPDMGGITADGKMMWLGGRYNGEVYAVDLTTGKLAARIPVGKGPHGVCVYPQPGRYSLGHTGLFR